MGPALHTSGRAASSPADHSAAQADLELRNDLLGMRLARTRIGKHFDPALGFVRRLDQDEWYGSLEVRPRFEASDWARQASLLVQGSSVRGTAGDLQSRVGVATAGFTSEFGDMVFLTLLDRFERLAAAAAISQRELAPGDYRFRSWEAKLATNESRDLSGFAGAGGGGFWSGTHGSLSAGLSFKTGPHLTIGGSLTRNDISLPVADGDFTTTIATLDLKGAVSRKLFANGLIQWDDLSKELQANIRVNWIHTPGSDLFVVVDTGYLTDGLPDPRETRWPRRAALLKLTWLKTF